ncbi:hypothetical protein [Polaribacter sp.]|uniref:hypothetical protein n=1 Tax=Polaribacter sp. TaxID=1920175 RepID=UPI003F6D0A7A
MKEINALQKAIKTLTFFFILIVFLYPIKALFAFMEEDLTFLGMVIDDSKSIFLWIKFTLKFIANIVFFMGIRFLLKTLNFNTVKKLFDTKKVLLFKKTGQYFLQSAAIGSLIILVDIFDGKFANLKMSTDFIFILYFSMIIGFFFFVFSKVLEAGKKLQQENDLTI